MHSSIFLILLVLGLGYVHAGCESNCTNGVEDEIFIGGTSYQGWGIAYQKLLLYTFIHYLLCLLFCKIIILLHCEVM